jgi:glucose/arabinose dehydrogenase
VSRHRKLLGALAVAWMTTLRATLALAQPSVPPGFIVENAVPGAATFMFPTGIAFFPDGRLLVAEKAGFVWIIDGAGKHSPAQLDIHAKVHSADPPSTPDDRGLLDVAVDPDFNNNLFIYLLYTVDPDTNNTEPATEFCYGRLVRYQMTSATSNTINTGSRAVLFGRTWPEGPTSISPTHTIGSLRWGADGSLLVSAGEGAAYTFTDAGGNQPTAFGPQKTSLTEDVGAFRAQYLGSLAGKILRLDPSTGLGYPSNPFWDGNAGSKPSRIWAYGLRNPFRFCVRPGTGSSDPAGGNPGTLYIGDVGMEDWEELSIANQGGRNFGWPCYEGTHDAIGYPSATPNHSGCSSIGQPDNPSPHTPPISDWNHRDPDASSPAGIMGQAASGSAFYTGTSYPAMYQGAYFYADYGASWIRVIQMDGSDNPIDFLPFGDNMDAPVDLVPNPLTGDLYYVAIATGEVRRISYTPVAAVEPTSRSFRLSEAIPNPTRGPTTVSLDLERAAVVSVVVHDIQGRKMWSSPTRHLPAGHWPITWTPTGMRSGVYLIDVAVSGQVVSRRVAVLK